MKQWFVQYRLYNRCFILELDEAQVDLKPVDVVKKGRRVSFKVAEKIRPSEKLYKLVAPEELKKK